MNFVFFKKITFLKCLFFISISYRKLCVIFGNEKFIYCWIIRNISINLHLLLLFSEYFVKPKLYSENKKITLYSNVLLVLALWNYFCHYKLLLSDHDLKVELRFHPPPQLPFPVVDRRVFCYCCCCCR